MSPGFRKGTNPTPNSGVFRLELLLTVGAACQGVQKKYFNTVFRIELAPLR
jgi:hypothetical protein